VQKTAKNAREKRRMPSKSIKKRPSHRFFSAEGEFVRFLRKVDGIFIQNPCRKKDLQKNIFFFEKTLTFS
jgi:hypothetical protein